MFLQKITPNSGVRRILGISIAFVAYAYYGMSIKAIIVLGIFSLFFLFVILPFFFRWCSTLQRHMVFLPWVHWPKHINFSDPESEGLSGTINFYLETSPKVKVGVWHILPKSLVIGSEGQDKEWFTEKLGNGKPIVLYMHGNTGSRAREHRLNIYHIFQDLDYHTVAFDYRGYADSSRVIPTKTGVITDAKVLYDWVRDAAGIDTPIIVHGHSLGAAVSTQAVAEMCREAGGINGDHSRLPAGLVLESPFNNIHEEVTKHPMTALWRKMPWFEWFFSGTLTKNDVGFVSDQHIKDIHIPILILHAKDDAVIPFELGYKLYQVALQSRSQSHNKIPITFVPFESDRALGHTFIYSAPEIRDLIGKFVENCATQNHDTKSRNGLISH